MHDITQGTIITPSCTVINSGGGATPSGNAVDGKPILRATWRIDGTIIGFGEYGLAVPGGSTITMTMTSNPDGSAGTVYNTSGLSVGAHTISVEMDAPNFIPESNETNNILTTGFNVLASSGSRPGAHWPGVWNDPFNLPVGSLAAADTRLPAGYFNSWGSWSSTNGYGLSVFNAPPDANLAQAINLSLPTEGHVDDIGGGGAPHAGDKLYARSYYEYGSPSFSYYGWTDFALNGPLWGMPGNGYAHGGNANNPLGKSSVAGYVNMAGLLRTYDIINGGPKHAARIAQPGNAGASTKLGPGPDGQNFCWPANSWDIGQTYSGLVPVGSLLYLPASVNLASLGVTTTVGNMVAKQMQDYGGYIYDSTYSNPGAYAAEPNCFNRSDFTAFMNSGDMFAIGAQLVRMVNNTQATQNSANCAGGGTPRTAFAPVTVT